jgi:hypothetical protein
MPTYRNDNTTAVAVGSLRIEPGQSAESLSFIQNLPAGVVKTTDVPFIGPIVSSTKLTATGTVPVPATYLDSKGVRQPLTQYEIEIYVGTGECQVTHINASNIPQYLGLYQKMTITCLEPTIPSVIITISVGTVYVTIRKI